MKLVIIFLIACLWACNQSVSMEAEVSGKLSNYKGKKVFFEICGRDSVVKSDIDTAGYFAVRFDMPEGSYVRMVNGKAVLPLYVAPGSKMRIEMDAEQVKDGKYETVVFKEGDNKETRMLLDYYQKQWFPATQEMFVLPPAEFKQMIDSVIRFNDQVIDQFLVSDAALYDSAFVKMFKLQIKVPFAASYYYYPMYHSLMNPSDSSEVPADFNLFDKILPKNNPMIYNGVYRYKTYEVSYWNNLLSQKLQAVAGEPQQFFNAYIDELNKLNLNQQIRDDVGNNLIMQYAGSVPKEVLDIFKNRYKEIVANPRYRQEIEKVLN